MARFRREGVVALVSGGLESAVLVQRLLAGGARVWPLYVRCGLRWEAAELAWLRRWLHCLAQRRLKPLGIVELPVGPLYGSHWSLTNLGVPSVRSSDAAVYLPGRNVLLLGAAAVYASRRGASRLALGTLKGNPFGDAAPEFFRSYARVLSQALSRRMRIEVPLRRLTKAQIIAAHPAVPYQMTWSCISPATEPGHPYRRGSVASRRGWRRRLMHCGRCNKCAERRRAFRHAGVVDPTDYAT